MLLEIRKISKNKMNRKYNKLKYFYYFYFRFFIQYFSWKKFFNMLKSIYEFKVKAIKISSIPFVINFDISNVCILNCALCATGQKNKAQTKHVITFLEFKTIFDNFKKHLFFIRLYNWGEPFLCKDIFKIVDYCHQNNVGVQIHSNLNYHTDELLEKIVTHKVDYLHLSIDGYTQENYEFYRQGGDIKKAFYGLEKIIEYKKKLNNKRPILHWGYLINNKNKDEVERAYAYAKKIGVNIFETCPMSLKTAIGDRDTKENYDKFLSDVQEDIGEKISPNSCSFLWSKLTISSTGFFSPCEAIYSDADAFGTMKEEDNPQNIVNTKIFTESRKIFKYKNYQPKCFTPCQKCRIFKKQ